MEDIIQTNEGIVEVEETALSTETKENRSTAKAVVGSLVGAAAAGLGTLMLVKLIKRHKAKKEKLQAKKATKENVAERKMKEYLESKGYTVSKEDEFSMFEEEEPEDEKK